MRTFHVEWTASGSGRKTRIFAGPIRQFDAAVDPASGLLVILVARDASGVYVLPARPKRNGRDQFSHPTLRGSANVAIEEAGSGDFAIKADQIAS